LRRVAGTSTVPVSRRGSNDPQICENSRIDNDANSVSRRNERQEEETNAHTLSFALDLVPWRDELGSRVHGGSTPKGVVLKRRVAKVVANTDFAEFPRWG
jgi:hypothetical protein